MFVNYGGGQYMFFEHAKWHGEFQKFIIKKINKFIDPKPNFDFRSHGC